MQKILLVAGGALVAALGHAFTVASFQDPTIGESDLVVFTVTGSTIGAAYTGIELNVLGTTYSDVTLAMAPVAYSGAGAVKDVAAGSAVFSTGSDSNVLTITWDAGTFVAPFGFGASFASLQNVTFSGSSIPAEASNWIDQQFAFSFANPQTSADGDTYSASMTSSAVPEPATMAVLGLGVAALVGRRRRG
ncbi:MAG: PEP-CTERM sorting domain-containing protein [Fimbriimonadaceae bacterium]|nr:PEP-CTERM sorting domain-containing protein [Fimbriimonadaceae bacterium]